MPRLIINPNSRYATLLLGALTALFIIGIISYPDQAFQASIDGLNIWWKFVFPALLPVFILCELLIGSGWAHGIAVFLEPLMRVIFRLPGAGGLAIAMSLTGGLPAGAKTTADLKTHGLLGRRDSENVLAISHISNPLFIIIVVGIGFFRDAGTGFLLALLYYVSLLLAGLLMRLLLRQRESEEESALSKVARMSLFTIMRQALRAMRDAHIQDGRTFGKLLGDSVITSVHNLLVIGGYIMIFSVSIHILTFIGATFITMNLFSFLFHSLGIPTDFSESIWPGLLEIHLGTYYVSQLSGPSHWIAAFAGAALAWSGISSFFQLGVFAHSANIRLTRFIQMRLLHSGVVFILTLTLWNRMNQWFGSTIPGFAAPLEFMQRGPEVGYSIWKVWPLMAMIFVLILGIMSMFSILISVGLFIGRRRV